MRRQADAQKREMQEATAREIQQLERAEERKHEAALAALKQELEAELKNSGTMLNEQVSDYKQTKHFIIKMLAMLTGLTGKLVTCSI